MGEQSATNSSQAGRRAATPPVATSMMPYSCARRELLTRNAKDNKSAIMALMLRSTLTLRCPSTEVGEGGLLRSFFVSDFSLGICHSIKAWGQYRKGVKDGTYGWEFSAHAF